MRILKMTSRLAGAASLLGLVACSDAHNKADSGMPNAQVADAGQPPDASDARDAAVDAGPPQNAVLVACDGSLDGGCGDGICAGSAPSGFFCRTACPDDAAAGDVCDGGFCMENDGASGGFACVEIDSCDFMTADGCAAGESCVVLGLTPLTTACVPAGDGGPDTRCDPQGNACAPGLACLGSDLEDGDPGRCTTLCVPDADTPDNCAQCIRVTDELGTCAECSILDNDCDTGSRCYPTNELLGGVCVPFGPAAVDEECGYDETTACQEGLICIEQDNPDGPDPLRCIEVCDTAAPNCSNPDAFCNDIGIIEQAFETGKLAVCFESPGQFCSEARGLGCATDASCLPVDQDIGLCLTDCDPTEGDTSCDGNYACLPVNDDAVFQEVFVRGNGVCRDGCVADVDCGGGNTCLHLDDLDSSGVCGASCDPNGTDTCGDDTLCVATPENANVGACIPSGQNCTPSLADSCPGGTTCRNITGLSDSGVCMMACFVQAPNACGGTVTCLGKTEVRFHTGSCFGAPSVCDPIAQDDCDAGETCGVLGGGPFGGIAYRCSDAGQTVEGGACSDNDECAVGLVCREDVCRAYCDPGDDQCTTGSCTDVSETVYLAANSIGVCE